MASRALGQDLRVGLELGHYRIVEKIGAGGMGEVYRARDEHLARDVAIKVLPPGTLTDESARKHFRKEALILSQLNHPNVATIHDFDVQQGVDFLVMEYIPGVALSEKVVAGPLPEKEVLRLGVQLAEGLSAAHENGVVHRDLKPDNLRITSDGRLKILDFGLAKLWHPVTASAATESLSEPQAMAGTLPYMAPEQLLGGEIDARTDLHAAGLVLYEMATGRYLFADVDNSQLLGAILHRPPQPPTVLNPKLSPELGWIIEKCVEKEPEYRYQSAKELAVDLRRLLTPSAAKVAEVPVEGRKLWKVLVPAVVILVAAAIGGALYFGSQRAHVLTDRDTIVLSDFDNKTGDAVFDDTLKQGLSVQLEQSPFLALVSDQKVGETLKLMGRAAGDRLTPEVTREVCQRAGSKAMVTGSIAGLGSQYVIGLKAVTCDTGDMLAAGQEQAASKEAVLKALDAAAVSLRRKLGESPSSVQKYATPLEEATTPSLEALKAYSLGMKAYWKQGTDPLPFFERAVELDPNFAVAYRGIAERHWDTSEAGLAAEYSRKAYNLREKVSERERLDIEGDYHWLATGELEKAAQTYDLRQQTYPRDFSSRMALGVLSLTLGNREKGLEEFREALRLDPNDFWGYNDLGVAYEVLNRLDEAEMAWKEAEVRRKGENEMLLQNRYIVAFLKGNAAQMAHLASAAMGKPGTEDLLLAMQADTEGWYGKLKDAHELTQRAMDSAQHNGTKERAAVYQASAALREVESGKQEQARAEAKAALNLALNRDVRDIAVLTLARAGDTPAAEKLVAELEQDYPLDTLVQTYWLPAIRAVVALERKEPNRAIELLQVGSNIELGVMVAGNESTIALCPAYLRGEAYLALRDGKRAAAEFQKFIDYPGVVENFPWGALARLGLARAYAMEGNTAKARTAYQDFLTLWKDADPDIPILKQAKAEYAKVQ